MLTVLPAVMLLTLASAARQAAPRDPPSPKTSTSLPATIRGDDLLRQVAATYANCKTYRDSGTTVEKWTSSFRKDSESPFDYALVHPGRLRFTRNERSLYHDGGHSVYWSDGERVREWRHGKAEPFDLHGLLGGWYAGGTAGDVIVPLVLPGTGIAPFLGWSVVEEPRHEAANGVDCWRVGLKRNNDVATLWVDASRFVILRFDEGEPFPGDWRAATTTFSPRLDESVDESLLQLTPPAPELHDDFQEPESFLLAFALDGAALALLGLRALQLRRPFVVPTLVLLPLAILPALLHSVLQLCRPFRDFTDWSHLGLVDVTTLSFFALAIVLPLWFHLRGFAGYTFFGIDETTMFKALKATLDALGLEHVIKERVVRLKGRPTEFRLSLHSWQGTGALSTKKSRDAPLLRDLVRGIRVCFESHTLALSRAHCVKYVVGGSVLATGLVAIDLLLHRR